MSSETAKPATKPGTKTPEPVILPDNAFIFDAGSMDTATPTIRGYASANTDVIVTVEGQTYATVSDQRGSWAIDIDSPLPQGEVVVAARAETPQGDMYFAYRININAEAVIEPAPEASPETSSIAAAPANSRALEPSPAAAASRNNPDPANIETIEDNVGKYQGVLANGAHTDDDIPLLKGKVEPGYSVLIYDNGVFLEEVFADFNDGSWRYSPTTALPEGEHNFTIEVRDFNGNTSVRSEPYSITVDRSIAPPTIERALDNVGNQTGPLGNGANTDDATPTLQGKAEAGAEVEIFIDGNSAGSVTADANGDWAFTPAQALADGQHEFSAIQTDLASNTSGQSQTFNLNLATNNAPDARDDSATTKKGEPIKIDVLANDSDPDGDAIAVTRIVSQGQYGQAVVNVDGTISYTPNDENTDATDTFSYEIADGKGGTDTAEVSVELEPGLRKPTIDLAASSDSGWYDDDDITNDLTPLFQGTASPGASVTIQVGKSSYTSTTADAEGNWSVEVDLTSWARWLDHTGTQLDIRAISYFADDQSNQDKVANSDILTVTFDNQLYWSVQFHGDGIKYRDEAGQFRYTVQALETMEYEIRYTDNKNVRYEFKDIVDAGRHTVYPNVSPDWSWGRNNAYVSATDVAGNYNFYTYKFWSDYNEQRPVIVNRRHYDPIAALEDGGYIVTYLQFDESGSNGFELLSQRYDAAGQTVGDAVTVNSHSQGDQINSDVVGLADGGYVVSWQSSEQDGDGFGIYSQRYNAAGERVGEETQVNTYTQADQREPQMVALDNGGYAIVWMSNTQDGSGQGVYLRLYNSAGEPQGDEIQINNQTEHDQYLPTIASLADGNIVVTWESADSSGQLDVYAQILSPTGEIIVDDFVVANGAQYQNRPFVAAIADGGFAISYVDTDLDAGQQRTMLQRFNANGSASGAAILVSETSDMLAYKPEITGLQDGSVVITWVTLEDNPDHYDYQVMMARYDANGEQLLAPQSVTSPDMLQVEPHITSLNDGGYLITWTHNDLELGSSTVVGQRFDTDNQRIGEAFEVGQVFSPNHSIDSEQGDAVTDAETIDPGLIDTDLIDPEFNWGNELLEPEFDAELDLPELNLGDLLGDEAELDDLLATLPAPSASSTEAQPSEPAPSSTEPPAWDNLPMDDKWLACWDDISYMIP